MAEYQTKHEGDQPVDDDSTQKRKRESRGDDVPLTSHKGNLEREGKVPKVDDSALAKKCYKAGKALMLSQKFAEGAKALEKAIALGSDDARALLAVYLMWGRKGLPVDRERAFDLANQGALDKSRACQLCLGYQSASMAGFYQKFSEYGCGAFSSLDEAMSEDMKVSDPDLVNWLHSLLKGTIHSQPFTLVYSPLPHLTHVQANLKGKLDLMEHWPGFPSSENQYQLGTSMRYSNPAEALVHLTNAAREGHPEALYQLALIYKGGLCGQEKDEERGNALMEQAAEAGSASAKRCKEA